MEDGRKQTVVQYDSDGAAILSTSFGYDPHGRVGESTDGRNGTTDIVYNGLDQIISSTLPAAEVGETRQTTEFAYDERGRRTEVTHPDTSVTEYEYFLSGDLKKQSGSQTYTVEYTYDPQGRMKTMLANGATTTWNYHSQRGWLENKRYADSNGPAYTYSPTGRLVTRLWARGVTTVYGHDNAGQLTSIDYSDATPDVTFEYDTAGRKIGQTDAAGAQVLKYVGSKQSKESISGGILDGLTIDLSYDRFSRRTNLRARMDNNPFAGHEMEYDRMSRVHSVSDGSITAEYQYLPGSNLVQSFTVRQGDSVVLQTRKAWDNLNRLKSIRNVTGKIVNLSKYQYNSMNQRTKYTLEDGTSWQYAYDSFGQVNSGIKKLTSNDAISGYDYGYAFDGIGNRTGTTVNGASATYMPNNLNQYESRTVPGKIDVVGTARAEAIVSVNDQPAERQGQYFHKQLSVNNASDPVFEEIHVKGVNSKGAAGATDAVELEQGQKFVPKTPETFSYDLDGNCTGDGRWDYGWDGENRLISLIAKGSVPSAAKKKLVFTYDGSSRRIRKQVFEWDGGESDYAVAPVVDIIYLYDGWNMIGELDQVSQSWRSFLWGLDLSGSMQGAGGIGGLIAANINNQIYAYSYDGNGNVVSMADGDGQVVASYEYGPFGETIRANGVLVNLNPFQFSTKYCDLATGFYYYGFRYYNPGFGRWLSRDPIGEVGGNNLYGMVDNDSIDQIDPFGLQTPPPGPPVPVPTPLPEIISRGTVSFKINDLVNHAGLGTITLGVEMLRTGELRLDYARLAAELKAKGLSPAEANAARDALKLAFREKQTALGKALTQQILQQRAASGFTSGQSNPTKTNLKINAQAVVLKNTGRAMAGLGFVIELYSVASAPEGEKYEEAARAGGRLAGGATGATIGGGLGVVGGAPGVAAGIFVGGFVGSIIGEGVVNLMCQPNYGDPSLPPPRPWELRPWQR